MKTARQKTDNTADKLINRGEDTKHVAMTLLHAGLDLLHAGLDLIADNEKEKPRAIIVRRGDNQSVEIEWAMPGYKLGIMPAKDERSDVIAEKSPQEAARSAQEADLLPGTALRPYKGSTEPLDRVELLAWLDMKLDGCAKHGMREASDILQAFRGEVAQHLERRPIDMPFALRTFYEDVYQRNVAAGWWTDIRTNEPKKRSVGELFILFVTELVEAYDAYCAGDQDDKLPQYPGLGVELGDLQIRFADFAGALQAGNIVRYEGVPNPGDVMFREIAEIARRYESIRKSPEAIGQRETGEPFEPMDVAEMIYAKLEYNATRANHKIENRLKEGGKQT